MNRCYLSEDKIRFLPWEGESYEVCGIEEINIVGGSFIWDGQCYPLDEKFLEEKMILDMWNTIYPNGNADEIITPQLIITENEKYRDMVDQLMTTYLLQFPIK